MAVVVWWTRVVCTFSHRRLTTHMCETSVSFHIHKQHTLPLRRYRQVFGQVSEWMDSTRTHAESGVYTRCTQLAYAMEKRKVTTEHVVCFVDCCLPIIRVRHVYTFIWCRVCTCDTLLFIQQTPRTGRVHRRGTFKLAMAVFYADLNGIFNPIPWRMARTIYHTTPSNHPSPIQAPSMCINNGTLWKH